MQCASIKQYTIQQYRAIIYVIGNSSDNMIIHHFTVLIHRMSIPLICDLTTRYFRFQLIQIAISIYFQILTDATNSTFEMAVCRDGLTSTGPTRRGRNTRPDTRSMEGPRCVADTRRRPWSVLWTAVDGVDAMTETTYLHSWLVHFTLQYYNDDYTRLSLLWLFLQN